MQSYALRKLFSYVTPNKGKTFVRAFHHVKQNGVNIRNSLQYRFAKHLSDSITVKKQDEHSMLAPNHFPGLEITKGIGVPSLSSILNDLQDLGNVVNPWEIQSRLNKVDKQSCRMLRSLSFDETLSLLHKLFETNPSGLLRLSIYPAAIDKLCDMLLERAIDSGKVVNLLFFTSLSTSRVKDVKLILKYLPDIGQLSVIEQCIVSVATFKNSVKLSRKHVQTIEDTVHDNLDSLFNEPGLFVSLLKALRYNGPSMEFSLTPISKKLLANEERYLISLAVPILALYAEMLKLEEHVLNRLVGDSISHLNNIFKLPEANCASMHYMPVRPKDVSRLLWATSRLDYRLTENQLSVVESYIDANLNAILTNAEICAGILLSLWMLQSPRSHERVDYCFGKKIFNKLLCQKQEDRARLYLLLDCVRIEAPGITIPPELTNTMEDDTKPLKFSVELKSLSRIIKCLALHFNFRDTVIDCPIKSLRIYGVSMRHESLGLIHVDVLNSITCLRDTRSPNGLMSLKLRLVKRLGYHSILLDEAEHIEEMVCKIEETINSI